MSFSRQDRDFAADVFAKVCPKPTAAIAAYKPVHRNIILQAKFAQRRGTLSLPMSLFPSAIGPQRNAVAIRRLLFAQAERQPSYTHPMSNCGPVNHRPAAHGDPPQRD